jgi:methylthioribulose-1-phosphate dehydratase
VTSGDDNARDDECPGASGPHSELAEPAQLLIDAARALYRRGWMEGTAGNLSLRLPAAGEALITASGKSKGALTIADVVRIRIRTGTPIDEDSPRPSAETAIHAALLRAFPDSAAVVHAHPPYSTIVASRASRASARPGIRLVTFDDFELIKGLGVADPSQVTVPVFSNWPDVACIGSDIEAHYATAGHEAPRVLLVAYHGATAWGPTLDAARNALECLEALCQLQLLSAMAAAMAATSEETS